MIMTMEISMIKGWEAHSDSIFFFSSLPSIRMDIYNMRETTIGLFKSPVYILIELAGYSMPNEFTICNGDKQ